MISLDVRIANLQQKRRTEGVASEKAVAEMNEAAARAREAFDTFSARSEALEKAVAETEEKVSGLRNELQSARVVGLLVALVIVGLAFWAASAIREAAEREAVEVRQQNAVELAEAHEAGRREIAALREEVEAQRSIVEADVIEAGVELAALVDERDAVRTELEGFAALRERVGFQLVELRGHVVIVVPEGQEIRSWRVPGISTWASYNGRMYRAYAVE